MIWRGLLLATTAILTPTLVEAAPVVLFFQGVAAGLGGLAFIPGLGGAFTLGVGVGAFLASPIGALLANFALRSLFQPKRPQPQIDDAIVNTLLPDSTRWLAAGNAHIGGTLGHFAETDEDGNFWYFVVHADTEMPGDPTYFLDGIEVTLSDGTDGFTAGDVITDDFCLTDGYAQYEGTGTKVPYFRIYTVSPDGSSAFGSNLLTRNTELDHADWTKTRLNVTANATSDPILRVAEVDLIYDDNTASNTHEITQSPSFTAGSVYEFVAFVKNAQATPARQVRLQLPAAAFEAASEGAYFARFNLVTGEVAGLQNLSQPGIDHNIRDIGEGWYRISIKATAQTTASGEASIRLLDENGAPLYDGDGASGIYLYKPRIRTVSNSGGVYGLQPSAFTTAFSGSLPSDFYLAGSSYSIVRVAAVPSQHYRSVYKWRGRLGLGEPGVTVAAEFGRMFDPREAGHDPYDPSTWEKSDGNPALIWAWYETHPYGRNRPMSEVNWTGVDAAADTCDVTRLNRSAVSIPTYKCAVAISDSRPRGEGQQEILATMDAIVVYDENGRAHPKPGKYEAPTLSFYKERDIGAETTQITNDGEAPHDGVVVYYISPDHGYTRQPAAPWYNDDWYDGFSEPDLLPVDILGCQDHSQAYLLAQAIGKRVQPTKKAGLATGLRGMLAKRERIIDLNLDADFTGDFEIATPVERGNQSFSFAVVPVDSGRWTVDAPNDEGTPPAPTPALNIDASLEVASNVVILVEQVAVATGNGVRLKATFDTPSREDRSFRFRYIPTAGGTYEYFTTDMEQDLAYSAVVTSGTEYRVSWQTITAGGRATEWSDDLGSPVFTDITPTAEQAPAGDLSGVSATIGPGRLEITGTAGANTSGLRVYRNTSNDFGAATDQTGIIAATPLVAFDITAGDATATDVISNGGFDSATDWTTIDNVTISGGVASSDSGGAGWVEQAVADLVSTPAEGDTLRVTLTISNRVSGSIYVSLDGSPDADSSVLFPDGTYTVELTVPNSLTRIRFRMAIDGDMDDVSAVVDTDDCLPSGAAYYWVVPVSPEGIEGTEVALGELHII